jgi:hypothetical protein
MNLWRGVSGPVCFMAAVYSRAVVGQQDEGY